MLFTQLKQPIHRILWVLFLLGCIASPPALADTVSSISRLFEHDNRAGDKASDTVVLRAPKVTVGQCVLFVDASIKYKKQRFGKVSIVSKPVRGCNPARQRCTLKTSVKYAPSGHVHYWVEATWEVKPSGC